MADPNYDDDGYLNPLVLLPGALHPSALAPATLRPALLCIGRGWIRIGSGVVPITEWWAKVFDDRPTTVDEAAELWMDSIGG